MDVVVTPLNSRLGMRFKLGTNPETGRDIIRTRSWGNLKHDATDQAVFDVAVGFNTLCALDLADIQRYDSKILED